jgi:hypothetical protein
MWRAWVLSTLAAAVASLAAADPAAAGNPEAPPGTANTDEKAVSLLGFNICVGDTSPQRRCHITLPALPQPQPPPPAPKRFTVLGKTLCIGGVPGQPGCDWHLPRADRAP